MLTHGNLTAAVDIFDVWGAPGREKRGGVIERTICVLPLFHIFALTTVLLLGLKHGNIISLHQRFDVDAVMRDIEVKRATGFPGRADDVDCDRSLARSREARPVVARLRRLRRRAAAGRGRQDPRQPHGGCRCVRAGA